MSPNDKIIAPLPTSTETLIAARGELVALNQRAEAAVDAVTPANTRRAYELELGCFASWCTRHGVRATPADPRLVRAYLRELADSGRHPEDLPHGKPHGPLGYSALQRALAAICTSQQRSGHPSIWKHPLISEALATFAREKGTAPRRQKRDLGGGEALLFRVCDLMGDDLRGLRDRAMLLVGWQGGGRRRSEIVAAHYEHFELAEGDSLKWTIPRSKADQSGKGLHVALTQVSDRRYCPVHSLVTWVRAAAIASGPVFRGITADGKVMDAALTPQAVARRVQHYVAGLGLDPSAFGGHSLRSGFVTTAYKMGRKLPDIMEATGHHNTREVMGYIRRAGLVEDSAARGLIDEALAKMRGI